MDDQRRLSDTDIAEIVDQLEKRMTKRFFENLGRGLWGMLLAALAAAILFLAAWGSRLDTH